MKTSNFLLDVLIVFVIVATGSFALRKCTSDKKKSPQKIDQKKKTNSKKHKTKSQKYRKVKAKKINAIVTAYCPCKKCCGASADGVTSTGKNAYSRGIAVDPKAISYGSKIYVPGYGLSKADDTGGAMRQSFRKRNKIHLDLRFKTHSQAKKWGRRNMSVFIIQ